MVTHTDFDEISQTRQIKLKFGKKRFLRRFDQIQFFAFLGVRLSFGERSEQVRQKNTKILSNGKKIVSTKIVLSRLHGISGLCPAV